MNLYTDVDDENSKFYTVAPTKIKSLWRGGTDIMISISYQ